MNEWPEWLTDKLTYAVDTMFWEYAFHFLPSSHSTTLTSGDGKSRARLEDVRGAAPTLLPLGKYEKEKEDACWHHGFSSSTLDWNSTKVKDDRALHFRGKAKAAQSRHYTSRQELLEGRGTVTPRGSVVTWNCDSTVTLAHLSCRRAPQAVLDSQEDVARSSRDSRQATVDVCRDL